MASLPPPLDGDADIGDAAGRGAVLVGARGGRGRRGARCPAAAVFLAHAIGRCQGESPRQVLAGGGAGGRVGFVVAEANPTSFSLWQFGLPDLPRRTPAESGTWMQWVERKLKVAKQQLSEKFGGAEGTKDVVRS